MKKTLLILGSLFLFSSLVFSTGVWETKLANDVIVATNTFGGTIFNSNTRDVQSALNIIATSTVSTTTLSGYAKLSSNNNFTDTNTFISTTTLNGVVKIGTGTGIVKETSGVLSTITDNSSNWNIAYSSRITSATSPLNYNNSNHVISMSSGGITSNGYITSVNWNTFNNKQSSLKGGIVGTTNQINVTANYNTIASTVTFSLPQPISTISNTTFANQTLTYGLIVSTITSAYTGSQYSITTSTGINITGNSKVAGNPTISSAITNGDISSWNTSGSTQVYITTNGTSYLSGGNVLIGTTTIALATSRLTVVNNDIRISTTTGSNGIIFQDLSKQIRAYAPVFVSSVCTSCSITVASLADVYITTITITQIGNKNLGIIGCVAYHSSSGAATHTISLYRATTLLQSWVHTIGANDDEPLPIMYFKDASSSVGSQTYTIRVHSSSASGTQTVTSYDWRIRED